MKGPDRNRGHTLMELMIYMALGGIGLSAGLSMYGADKLTSRRQEVVFRDSGAVAETLHVLAGDLRNADRVVPRRQGPGALVFLADGGVAVWFDRPGEPGVLYRRTVRGDAVGPPKVVARGVTDLAVDTDNGLFGARARAGAQDRAITVRRRP